MYLFFISVTITFLFQPLSCLIALYFTVTLPADVISTVEFNQTGDLLATGDKGGRVVIFQRETEVRLTCKILNTNNNNKNNNNNLFYTID